MAESKRLEQARARLHLAGRRAGYYDARDPRGQAAARDLAAIQAEIAELEAKEGAHALGVPDGPDTLVGISERPGPGPGPADGPTPGPAPAAATPATEAAGADAVPMPGLPGDSLALHVRRLGVMILMVGGSAYEVRAEGEALKFRKADRYGEWHTVRRGAAGYRCDCPDAQFRGRRCKHVIALEGWTMATMDTTRNLPIAAAALDAEVLAQTPAHPPLAAAATEPPRPLARLAQSLAKAQQECRAVAKNSTNTYHKYKYASAEAIIEEGNRVLATVGLVLAPVSQTVDGHAREGEHRFELTRKFLLIDSSGECLPISVVWPICPDKGRPLDKATGAAATLSLSYTLRDLLLMPRVDEADDVAGRDDRAGPAAGSSRKPVNPDAVRSATQEFILASHDERDRLTDLCTEYMLRPLTKELRIDGEDFYERELLKCPKRLTPEDLASVRAAWQPVAARLDLKPSSAPTKPR